MTRRPSARTGKPDPTGRSSGKFTTKRAKLMRPPTGEQFAWLTRPLLESDAWCAMNINERRLMDFLMMEHLAHAGLENGNLCATYDQLVGFGIGRRFISSAVKGLQMLGLIRVHRGGRWAMTNQPSRYRLTFYAVMETDTPASNEWKGLTTEIIKEWRKNARLADKRRAENAEERKQKAGSPSCTPIVHLRTLEGQEIAERKK